MPRSARLFIDNACNHIVARGNQQQTVFRDDDDFRFYLNSVHKYKVKYDCRIYAYCLMDDHVHFLLESPSGAQGMSRFMHDLSQSYAMKFNSKYNRVGHLWQNRYKNYVVLKDEYLFNVIEYIEFNPVRAKKVLKPEDYPWSSYRGRVLGEKNIILDTLSIV